MEIKVTDVKDLRSGEMRDFESNGKRILIANLNGKYYAIGNICTHSGCSLSDGSLNEEKIECPCHGSTFDVRTGAVLEGPAINPEPVFAIRVDGSQIFVVIEV